MLAKERLLYILKRLNTQPSISIQELSKEMNVSLSTVQRDLRKLEKEGKIERSRGGALSSEYRNILSSMSEVAVSEKVHLHENEKDLIAKKAASLIKEGECIFLDSGTTLAHIVPYVMNKCITIVTNSMYLHRKLMGCKASVYLIGGRYSPKFDMTLGASVITQLENLRFDRAFLSTSGADIVNKELYSVESEIALIKKMVIQRSKKNYVLMDHSKFDIKAMYTYARFDMVDYIISDAYPKEERMIKNVIVCGKK